MVMNQVSDRQSVLGQIIQQMRSIRASAVCALSTMTTIPLEKTGSNVRVGDGSTRTVRTIV